MEFNVEELIRKIEIEVEENVLQKEMIQKEKEEDKVKISYVNGIDAAYDKVLDIINDMLTGKKETAPTTTG